jgi:hypothetical protein
MFGTKNAEVKPLQTLEDVDERIWVWISNIFEAKNQLVELSVDPTKLFGGTDVEINTDTLLEDVEDEFISGGRRVRTVMQKLLGQVMDIVSIPIRHCIQKGKSPQRSQSFEDWKNETMEQIVSTLCAARENVHPELYKLWARSLLRKIFTVIEEEMQVDVVSPGRIVPDSIQELISHIEEVFSSDGHAELLSAKFISKCQRKSRELLKLHQRSTAELCIQYNENNREVRSSNCMDDKPTKENSLILRVLKARAKDQPAVDFITDQGVSACGRVPQWILEEYGRTLGPVFAKASCTMTVLMGPKQTYMRKRGRQGVAYLLESGQLLFIQDEPPPCTDLLDDAASEAVPESPWIYVLELRALVYLLHVDTWLEMGCHNPTMAPEEGARSLETQHLEQSQLPEPEPESGRAPEPALEPAPTLETD